MAVPAGYNVIPFPPVGGQVGWNLVRRTGIEYVEWAPPPLRLNQSTGELEVWQQRINGQGNYVQAEIVIDEGTY